MKLLDLFENTVTDDPKFRQWFGNSKSVDNSGQWDSNNPMMHEDQALTELQMRYRVDGEPLNTILAFRGNVWLLGTWQDLEDTPENVILDIYKSVGDPRGADGAGTLDLNGQDFERWLEEITDSRPDVVYGTIDKDTLYLRSGMISPAVSPMIKKVVQELGLTGVQSEGSDYYGDEDNYWYTRGELKGDLPDTLFHGTDSHKLMKIAKTGLRPSQDSNWKDSGITHEGLIFGAPSLEGAVFHANRTSKVPFDPDDQVMDPDDAFPVIIELKVPDKNLLEPDYDVASTTMGYTDKADELGYTNKANYGTFSPAGEISKNNPEGRVWKSGAAFAYRGRIPASHVVRVYSNFFDGGALTTEFQWAGTLADFFERWEELRQEHYGFDDEEDDY